MNFCPQCGNELVTRSVEGRERPTCPRCGFVAYQHLKVGAAVIARRGKQMVLLRRSREPFAGCWSLPAGYVEADEAPADAAVRECREETGLDVAVDGLFGVYFFDDDPRGHGVLIVYLATIVGGELGDGDEGPAAFFSPDELPAPLAGAGHSPALHDWAQAQPESAFGSPFRFCPRCANRLAVREAFGRPRPVCDVCGFIYFRDPKVAVGVLIEEGGRVLMAQRGIDPGRGKWYMPSGFMEWDETPTEAAIREVREETGLEVALDGLVGVYPINDGFGRRGVWICYRGHIVGGEPAAADDAVALGFFALNELPDVAFESTRWAIEDWRQQAITSNPKQG